MNTQENNTPDWSSLRRGQFVLVLKEIDELRPGQILEFRRRSYFAYESTDENYFRMPDGSNQVLSVYDYDEISPFEEIFELLDDNDPRIEAYRERYLANIYPCPYQEGKKYVALQNIQEIKKGKVLTYEGMGTSGHGERLNLYFVDWLKEPADLFFDTSQEKPDWKKLFRRYPFWNAWLGRF